MESKKQSPQQRHEYLKQRIFAYVQYYTLRSGLGVCIKDVIYLSIVIGCLPATVRKILNELAEERKIIIIQCKVHGRTVTAYKAL